MPFVTIYKADQPSLAQMAGLGVVNPSVRLSCLPLWCVLRSLGQDQVIFLTMITRTKKRGANKKFVAIVIWKISLLLSL